MPAAAAPGEPEASWTRARRHYARLSKQPGFGHVAGMNHVLVYAQARGFYHHYHAYVLPDFLAVSTATTPEEALTTPFLSISIDQGGFYELSLVSPASEGPVVPIRSPQSALYHELDTCFAALGELLVAHYQGERA